MRTELTLSALIERLQANCGDMLSACRSVGVSLIFVNTWRKDDPEVNERLLEAERVGVQGLVSEAIRRATGYDDDIVHKGIVTGRKRAYSDGLLNTLLKAKLPEFSTGGEGGGVHVNVQVANLMPRADTYDAWLAMKDDTFKIMREQERRLLADHTIDMVPDVSDAAKAAHRIMAPAFGGIEL